MQPAKVEETRELEDTLHDAAGRLSAAHVAALVAHPDAVRSVLAAAANVLSTGDRERRSAVETIEGGEPMLVGEAESERRLSARTQDGPPETLLTSEEMAERAGLKTRQSVHDWRKNGKHPCWTSSPNGADSG